MNQKDFDKLLRYLKDEMSMMTTEESEQFLLQLERAILDELDRRKMKKAS